jgi:hypothetical protein
LRAKPFLNWAASLNLNFAYKLKVGYFICFTSKNFNFITNINLKFLEVKQ